MVKKIACYLILIFSNSSMGQTIEEFEKQFINAKSINFNTETCNEIINNNSYILFAFNKNTQLTSAIKGVKINSSKILNFKNTKAYKENIDYYITSENRHHRILAYVIIGATQDKNYEQLLLTKLKKEQEKSNKIWCVIALIQLKTNHTTKIFDFLVENESFDDAHFLPMYFTLDKDSIQATAYKRIKSDNVKAKILAAQSLAKTKTNPKTEKLLLEAIQDWEISIKGYAIYSIKELGIGNLKSTFIPLLDNNKTRKIALQAMVNSKTPEDVNYIKGLITKNKKIDKDILDAFLKSEKTNNTKYWLKLLTGNNLPEKYYFSTLKNQHLFDDNLLSNIHETLLKANHNDIKQNLIRVLKNRNDSLSKKVFLKYFEDNNSSVRYWTATTIKDTKDSLLVNKAIDLIKNKEKRVSPITEILINNKIDTLQTTYFDIYINNSKNSEWKNTSLNYLSTFPKQDHRGLFQFILYDENSKYIQNRYAARGLGNLQDFSSIERIIEISENERNKSDGNCSIYIRSLGKIKGQKSKEYISTFLNSQDKNIKKLASKTIEDW